ncbi:hypothetical protein [Umezawaea beigongshangensis]|uniref:hypothetical protein n=1 Tax=Umezawaea beigongshangensis TaxID=2780383 RepID=UPI0018F1ABF9|nr:hypothetical protein [Umezawaea beigongshangensis]
MFKKLGAIVAATAAGTVMLGGMASATEGCHDVCDDGHHVGSQDSVDNSDHAQVGLVNLNNTDILHNVNAVIGICDNNINVLGVQVPVEDVLNGVNLPVLSPGENEAEGNAGELCATGGVLDGGSGQSS